MWNNVFLVCIVSIQLVISSVILALIIWVLRCYIRARSRLLDIVRVTNLKMDKLLDELMYKEEEITSNVPAVIEDTDEVLARQLRRERLIALVVGGQAQQYGLLGDGAKDKGKPLTVDYINRLDEKEVDKLYACYEARLGGAITKTLGQSALQIYVGIVSMFLPIPLENQQKLSADLEADPFVSHALSRASCELYYRYGMLLAPLTAALTTAKHCRFGQSTHPDISIDTQHGSEGTGDDPTSSGCTPLGGRNNNIASSGGDLISE